MDTCCPLAYPEVDCPSPEAIRCPDHGTADVTWARECDSSQAHLVRWLWGPAGLHDVGSTACGVSLACAVLVEGSRSVDPVERCPTCIEALQGEERR
jgi:hypothetical protein